MSPTTAVLDTAAEAEALQVERIRAMTPGERASFANSLSRDVLRLSEAGVRQALGDASEREIYFEMLRRRYGADLAREVRALRDERDR